MPPARENSGVIGVLQNITFINIYSIAKLNVLKIQSFPLTLVFAGIHSTSLSPRAECMGYELKPFALNPMPKLRSVVVHIFLEQSDNFLSFSSGDRFASFAVTIHKSIFAELLKHLFLHVHLSLTVFQDCARACEQIMCAILESVRNPWIARQSKDS